MIEELFSKAVFWAIPVILVCSFIYNHPLFEKKTKQSDTTKTESEKKEDSN